MAQVQNVPTHQISGFLKPAVPQSSLRSSWAVWHVAARLATYYHLPSSSMGPTRPPPLSFLICWMLQSPSRIYSQKQRAAAAEGAASPTSPHKLSPPPFISPLFSSVFLAPLFPWSRQRGVWRWKAAAAQPHPQGIPQSLLPLSTPCLRWCAPAARSWSIARHWIMQQLFFYLSSPTPAVACSSPRRCSWPTSATACLQWDGATRWCRIPLSSLSPLIYFTPLCNNSYPPTGHRFPLDPLLAMETGVALWSST